MQTSEHATARRAFAMPFSRVLVPLDGTVAAERALVPATALALVGGASVWPVSAALASEALDRLGYLRRLVAGFDVPYVQPDVLDRDGAAETIESIACSYNRLHGGLIVCMSTRARPAVPELVVGGTAASVVRSGAAPVVLVGPEASTRWTPRNIVACLDGSAYAGAVVALAKTWARSMGLGCWLVQVGEDHDGAEDLKNATAGLRAEGVHADWELLHGSDVADAIVRFAATVPGALVAMTTHGRSGRRRLTMGSTATDIVRRSHTPVLVYRP